MAKFDLLDYFRKEKCGYIANTIEWIIENGFATDELRAILMGITVFEADCRTRSKDEIEEKFLTLRPERKRKWKKADNSFNIRFNCPCCRETSIIGVSTIWEKTKGITNEDWLTFQMVLNAVDKIGILSEDYRKWQQEHA